MSQTYLPHSSSTRCHASPSHHLLCGFLQLLSSWASCFYCLFQTDHFLHINQSQLVKCKYLLSLIDLNPSNSFLSLWGFPSFLWGFPSGSVGKNLPVKQEMRAQSLGWEDPLEKEMATHSSILAWESSQTEEPGRLQSIVLQRVGHKQTPAILLKVNVRVPSAAFVPGQWGISTLLSALFSGSSPTSTLWPLGLFSLPLTCSFPKYNLCTYCPLCFKFPSTLLTFA